MEPEDKLLHIHRHKINEKASRPQPGVLYYMRRFLWMYSRGKQIAQFSNELIIRTLRLDFGLQMRVGNAGSETPWHWRIQLFGLTWYFSTSLGRKFANWLTSRKGGYHHREIGFWTYGEEGETPDLTWSLWYDDDGPYRQRRRWQHGRVSLSPAEWIWGPLRYTYEDIASFETDIEMKEGSYPAKITLQKMTRGRQKKGQTKLTHIQLRKFTLDVDVPKGVPSHYDKSGGWKGDRTYGFGVAFGYPRAGYIMETVEYDWGIQAHGTPEWHIDAKAAVEAWVMTQRAQTGFREPQEQE